MPTALLGTWAVAVVAMAALVAHAEPPSVIVLSLDGVRHDQPSLTQLPALERMAREGARAESLIPVFPSLTFPSHVSLATGTYPDRHGIVSNVFRDRERGRFDYDNAADWMLAEPLWAAAERQGVPAATFFWVGSDTAWRGTGARYRMAPFDSEVPESSKLAQIFAWLDLPTHERPRLIMSWWHGSDHAGHLHGPVSDGVVAALTSQDRMLAQLLAGIDERKRWKDLTLLVVSDHGMSLATEGVDLPALLAAAGIRGEVLASSASAHVFLENPDQAEAAARALGAHPEVVAYAASSLPPALRLGPRHRIGDVVCITTPPNTFRTGALERALRLFDMGVGSHGYMPEHRDVHGILYAMGRGVAGGAKPGSVRAIDVAATVAALLGISPPLHSEGSPIDLSEAPEGSR